MSTRDRLDAVNFLHQVDPDNNHVHPNDHIDPEDLSDTDDYVDADNDQVDANSFVDNVQLQFKDDPSRYKEFIRIMKAYRKSRLDDREVVLRICELLVGYPSLVKKFNAFLPNGYYLVPSDMREEGESYVTLKTPEGDTVCPQDYTRSQLVSGVSNSLP